MAIIPTTWNPSDKGALITLSEGNLTATCSGVWDSVRSIASRTSGKFYFEITINDYQYTMSGVATSGASMSNYLGSDSYGLGFMSASSTFYVGNTFTANGKTAVLLENDDVVCIALDIDAGKLWYGKNGAWIGSGDPAAGTDWTFSFEGGTELFAAFSAEAANGTANFGDSAFSYTVPSGFESGFGDVGETTSIIDLNTEVKVSEEAFSDLLSSVIAGLESLSDLNSEITTSGTSLTDLKSDIAADFLTDFSNLKTEVHAKAQQIIDLVTDVRAGNQTLIDLNVDTEAKAQVLSDLLTDVRAQYATFKNLNTEITAVRSKWWLKTEIKAGCAARWNFNTEWNPDRFLRTAIEAKKPYEFSFKTQGEEGYAATEPSVEFKIPGYNFPLRTLFLDYISVGSSNEYTLQLWWARGLIGKGTLKNAKIKAEYIDTGNQGGFEVVTLDWISVKVGDGEYKTVNETALLLEDILCDSYINVTLKVECPACAVSRGLIFFKLIIQGDFREANFGDSIVYQDGSVYHSGLFDDYQSIDFISRLYVVNT